MSEESELRAKLDGLQDAAGGKRRKVPSKGLLLGGTALALMVVVMAGALMFSGSNNTESAIPMPVSNATDFPEDAPVASNLDIQEVPRSIVIERPVPTPDQATLDELERVRNALALAEQQLASAGNTSEIEAILRAEIDSLNNRHQAEIERQNIAAQNTASELDIQLRQLQAELNAQEAEFERERVRAQTEYATLLNQMHQTDPAEQERLRLEEEARLALEQRRQEQIALDEERRKSGLIALNNGSAGEEGSSGQRQFSANELFVHRNIEPVPVSTASQIANPEATVLQGTIIQASLETAIDSSLPGAIRAIISEDVHSLDGSSILIPAGSRVFGEYSSGINIGQRRILIAWTRIVTPDSRSISIASFGADRLGRSGTAGTVDTRFGAKFAGAAAISVIGAAPAVAASQSSDPDVADAISDVGDDLTNASSNALNEVLSIPPTIYVRQGERVTIILDRDIEVF